MRMSQMNKCHHSRETIHVYQQRENTIFDTADPMALTKVIFRVLGKKEKRMLLHGLRFHGIGNVVQQVHLLIRF